jgi:cyclase
MTGAVTRRRCRASIAGGTVLLLAGSIQAALGQQGAAPSDTPVKQDSAGEVQTWHVQGRVYIVAGAGANITVQVGDAAVEVVNAGQADMSAAVISAIRQISDHPIQFLIDTSADADVVGGSAAVAKTGHANTGQPGEPPGAGIVAQLNVLTHLSSARLPGVAIPTDAYEEEWAFFNDEPVVLHHAPHAHADGDTYVLFRRSDVISTGDLFDVSSYPVIDTRNGGSLDGLIAALNDIIVLMVPRENEEAGTYVIPGHGRVCDRSEIVNYRDALTIIQGRIRHYVAKGMTLEQVLAAKPTMDYDGIYGAKQSAWTTRDFVETAYREAHADHKKKSVVSKATASDGVARG